MPKRAHLTSTARRQVYLCGAGASVAPPACLPTVEQFLEMLERACQQHSGAFASTVGGAFHGRAGLQPPRFEQVVAILLEFDPDLNCLDYLRIDLQNGPRPNPLHRFLAAQLHSGATVITTNFDALIELAYLELFGFMDWPIKARLHKVHGSIQTICDGVLVDEDPGQLKADIASVAAGTPVRGEGGPASAALSAVNESDLVVFGYSFSDSFDITPALMQVRPRTVTVIEYVRGAISLQAAADALGLPGFSDIAAEWTSSGVEIAYLQGDPLALVSPESGKRANIPGARASISVPSYRPDQLLYLVARLAEDQVSFEAANALYRQLLDCSEDADLRSRSKYRLVRTLQEWDEVLNFEFQLLGAGGTEQTIVNSLILALNARSFLGPSQSFLAAYRVFKHRLGSEIADPSLQALALGRAYHCVANFLMNVGRPRWGLKFAEASLQLRTPYAGPTDILYAEYACCLSLALARDFEHLELRLTSFRNYAKRVGDESAKICEGIIEGLRALHLGDPNEAVRQFEDAKRLYTADGADNQIDPELELYLLEARLQREGWSPAAQAHLKFIARHVDEHGYAFFQPVVAALRAHQQGYPLLGRLDRLTKAHLKRAKVEIRAPK